LITLILDDGVQLPWLSPTVIRSYGPIAIPLAARRPAAIGSNFDPSRLTRSRAPWSGSAGFIRWPARV